ncbi:hypothetical protein [Maridesulfovibrio sp.]|uniref:hypothetical protein n=1 Tax=Maridesulfovibrio sp. TaxID=2795000 RepID=UPI003BABBA31
MLVLNGDGDPLHVIIDLARVGEDLCRSIPDAEHPETLSDFLRIIMKSIRDNAEKLES